MMRRRIATAAAGMALLALLAGCGPADPDSRSGVAQAAESFLGSEKAGEMEVTLAVEPVRVGENRFVVTFSDDSVTAAEVQVIMANMGHGSIVDLEQVASGRFEVTDPAINMEGKWMIRVVATLASGEEEVAVFYLDVPPDPEA